MNIINTAQLVKLILANFPETRDDDYKLWLVVITEEAGHLGNYEMLKNLSVERFLTNVSKSGFTRFDTVSRARRKLQAKYPELRGTTKVRAARADREELFKEFANQNV